MIWKPKEKELSLEEAVKLAKQELSRFWFGETPQIGGVKHNGQFFIYPLDKKFSEHAWLIFLLDATEFSGEAALNYAREWHRRYDGYDLHFLAILIPTYSFFSRPESILKMIDNLELDFAVAVDADDSLSRGMKLKIPPQLSLFNKNKLQFEQTRETWREQAELGVQQFLRQTDPGLPLLLPFQPKHGAIRDVLRVELGSHPKIGIGAKFTRETVRPSMLEPGLIFAGGNWTKGPEMIMTADPEAVLGFRSSGSRVSIIAESAGKNWETTIVSVEIRDAPAFEAVAAQDMVMEDSGQSVILAKQPRLYHMLAELPESEREITLRFPTANKVPVKIYGLRFGDG